MNNVLKTRVLSLIGAFVLIGAVACIDSPTSPNVNGKHAARDTTLIAGDTAACRSGWTIIIGRVVCNPEQ